MVKKSAQVRAMTPEDLENRIAWIHNELECLMVALRTQVGRGDTPDTERLLEKLDPARSALEYLLPMSGHAESDRLAREGLHDALDPARAQQQRRDDWKAEETPELRALAAALGGK